MATNKRARWEILPTEKFTLGNQKDRGMFKGLANIASLMKTAQEMQSKMAAVQENLKRVHVEGSAGGGMVTVEANGQQAIVACRIEQSLFDAGDREMIEELVVAATNQALQKAKDAAAEEMGKIAGDINIPGLGEMLSKLGLNPQ